MDMEVDLYWIILGGLMTIIGIIGNMISILVLRRKVMQSQNLNTFLLVQAVIDLCVVLTLLLRKWIEHTFDHDISDTNDFWCKSLHYLSSSFVDISSWNLVLMSLEKLEAVIRPLTSHVNRSVRCSKIKMVSVFLFLAFYNLPRLVFYGVEQNPSPFTSNRTEILDKCCYNLSSNSWSNNSVEDNNRKNKFEQKNYQAINMYGSFHKTNDNINLVSSEIVVVGNLPLTHRKIIGKCTHISESYTYYVDKYDNWIHIFIRIIVPAVIMMVCNILIIRTISRRPILVELQSTYSNSKKTKSNLRRRIPPNTKLVVFVNLLFFVTCAPVSINRLYDCLSSGYNSSPSYSYLRLIALTHHSVGVIFNIFSGQRFRKELMALGREVKLYFGSYYEKSKKALPSITLELSASKSC